MLNAGQQITGQKTPQRGEIQLSRTLAQKRAQTSDLEKMNRELMAQN